MTTNPHPALSILRRKQVETRTGLGKSSLYEKISSGNFPAPVSLGVRAVGWLETEVNDWLASRVRCRPAVDLGRRA